MKYQAHALNKTDLIFNYVGICSRLGEKIPNKFAIILTTIYFQYTRDFDVEWLTEDKSYMPLIG